ncbi:MAG: hypothetical protein AAFY60_20790, partial [Myxococcota bacterium]
GDIEHANWSVSVGAKLSDSLSFAMIAEGKTLNVSDGLPENPHVTFHSDIESFKIAMFDLLPRVLKSVEKKRSSAQAIQSYGKAIGPDALFEAPGSIEVFYSDDAGDEAQVRIDIAHGRGPRAELRASDADLWAFLEGGGGLGPLLKARAQLSGDVGYLLRVVALLEP